MAGDLLDPGQKISKKSERNRIQSADCDRPTFGAPAAPMQPSPRSPRCRNNVEGTAMSDRYQMRRGDDDLWEVVDEVTGEIAKMGSVLLSGLDRQAAMGALDMLFNEIIEPNGQGSSGQDAEDA
jgi:hypothetical protein